jgi:predicted adenylyl cyclase CyaB
MKKEVEIRFKISSREKDKIISTLKKLNCNLNTRKETDIYFCDNKLVKTGDTSKSPYIIRVRRSKKENKLSYKSFSGENSWIEIESKIEDADSIIQILKRIGQAPYLEIRKKRQNGIIGKIELNIDAIESLGFFVELEKLTEDEKKAKKNLAEFAIEKLGIPRSRIIDKGYVQLMEQFLEKKK